LIIVILELKIGDKMKNLYYLIIIATILVTFVVPKSSFAVGQCDQGGPQLRCLGNALRVETRTGVNKQYVEVITPNLNANFNNTDFALEMQLRISNRITGSRQFITGIWGPGEDDFDVWVVYINELEELVFELNHPTEKLKSVDNTIVKIPLGAWANSWFFLRATFDIASSYAKLYVKGNGIQLTDSARNDQYPITRLKQIAGNNLNLLIGNSNAISNNPNFHSFYGFIDEYRLYNQLPNPCWQNLSLAGSESGMMLYLRFNEENVFSFCDASPNDFPVLSRNGATTVFENTRRVDSPFSNDGPINLRDTISCGSTKTYKIILRNTDPDGCSYRARLRVLDDPSNFNFSMAWRTINPGDSLEFEFEYSGTQSGTQTARVGIQGDDRCFGWYYLREWNITTISAVSQSTDTLDMGVMTAKCINREYVEKSFTLFNNTRKLGTDRPVNIRRMTLEANENYQILSPTSFPRIIAAGDSMVVRVRFEVNDTTAIIIKKVEIETDDPCQPIRTVYLKGEIEQAVSIVFRNNQGESEDFVYHNFGTVCLGYPSRPMINFWENIASQTIWLDSIIISRDFEAPRFIYPREFRVNSGQSQRAFRFIPRSTGLFSDTVTLVFRLQDGCILHYKILLEGRCIDPNFKILSENIDFGDVVVGRERQLPVYILNESDDPLDVTLTYNIGEPFYFAGTRARNIPPRDSAQFLLGFRPTEAIEYIDDLFAYNSSCYISQTTKIRGRGIKESLEIQPGQLTMESTIACESQTGVIKLTNLNATTATLDRFALVDANNKFQITAPNIPNLGTYTTSIAPGASIEFEFLYTPNDLTQDRSDRAFFNFFDQDDTFWTLQVTGVSEVPAVYLPSFNAYGEIEQGGTITKFIKIENITKRNILIDSIFIPNGFQLLSHSTTPNLLLKPNESVELEISFTPDAPGEFRGKMLLISSNPCQLTVESDLQGFGKVIPLEMVNTLLSYGFVRDCECKEIPIPLINNSNYDATITEITLSEVIFGDESYRHYNWYSDFSPDGNVPYTIAPRSSDTLRANYCPRAMNKRDSIDHSALLFVKADGNGWSNEFERYLVGRQAIYYEYTLDTIYFASTMVDSEIERTTILYIPDIEVNPNKKNLVIDSITFSPNDRVFSVSTSKGDVFPIVVDLAQDSLLITITFKPRAPKLYKANMLVHFAEPCNFIDSTVYLEADGFAQPYYVDFFFGSYDGSLAKNFSVPECDTAYVPLYSNRNIPVKFLDVSFEVKYSDGQFVGIESEYFDAACEPWNSYSVFFDDNINNLIQIDLHSICDIDTARPLLYLKFFKENDNFTTIVSDSFKFDSQDILNYNIISNRDSANTFYRFIDFSFDPILEFPMQYLIECDTLRLLFRNNNESDSVRLLEVLDFPAEFEIVEIIPPLDFPIAPGESQVFEIAFCPMKKGEIRGVIKAFSTDPCPEREVTAELLGFGEPEIVDLRFDFNTDFQSNMIYSNDFNDIIEVDVYIDRDLVKNYADVDHWLENFGFDLSIQYNPTALKYLEYQSFTIGNTSFNQPNFGNLELRFTNVDTLKAGRILNLKFKAMVPDSIESDIIVDAAGFLTDKIQFYEITPIYGKSMFTSIGQCNLTTIKQTSFLSSLSEIAPNPVYNEASIEFNLGERVPVFLEVYSTTGVLITKLLSGEILSTGAYKVQFPTNNFNSGFYNVIIRAGIMTETKKMIISK